MKEFGNLEGYEKNRYWEMRLPQFNFLLGGSNWLFRLCWRILTLIMLVPLLLAAKFYSTRLRLDNTDTLNNTTIPYQYFRDVYFGCVYSPLIKGYELELFEKCTMEEPILEIAIGDGYFSSLLFKLKGQKLDYGADLIYGTINSAKKYNHCKNYIVMDAVEIPLPDNCIGTVVMNNLMHHVPDRSLVLKEVLRVLKNGGKFIFTDNTIGWGIFTWEQMLLRGLRLSLLADYILRFKLKLFAQRLLTDGDYYDKKSKEENFRITKKINFCSKTSMYLGSIFELLNLKMGHPTRKEMMEWINFFALEDRIRRYTEDIIKYCIAKDKELTRTEGCAFQFVELEKLGERDLTTKNAPETIPYVCPRCKKALSMARDSYFCARCNIRYPIVDGIPIFISYQDKVEGFHSYLERKAKGKTEEFIT